MNADRPLDRKELLKFIGRHYREIDIADFRRVLVSARDLGLDQDAMAKPAGGNARSLADWIGGRDTPIPPLRLVVIQEIGKELRKMLATKP